MVLMAHVLMVHSADGAGTVPIPLGAVAQHISNKPPIVRSSGNRFHERRAAEATAKRKVAGWK